jgi:hypothetical protein
MTLRSKEFQEMNTQALEFEHHDNVCNLLMIRLKIVALHVTEPTNKQ